MNTSINELGPVQYFSNSSIGYSEAEEHTICEALNILRTHINDSDHLTSSQTSKNYCQLKIGHLEHEVFGVLFLNNQHAVLAYEELSRGTIDRGSVYPREVLKRVIANNAAAVILTHNHPSGNLKPSDADKRITRRLSEVLSLIDVTTLDHIIVSVNGTYSFAENGEMLS